LHHHYSPSYAPWYALTKNSIKKFHQRKSIFALSSFPSNKSIKGNPFLHYQVFHQENPSKEIHHMHNQIFHHIIIILFHHFFSSLLRGIICGGKIGTTNYAQGSACKKYHHTIIK